MRRNNSCILLIAMCVLLLSGCTRKQQTEIAKNIVINEIMASNRTGILNEKGKPVDWIEIKNNSNDTINLEDFELAVVKMVADSLEVGKQKEVTEKWTFPNVNIDPQQCMLIFANKNKKRNLKDGLNADFNLPKEGATVKLIAPDGKVINEVKFGELEPDYSYARQRDKSYQSTYWQSPGFDNNREGYESARIKMDEQRRDPLKIWEVMSRSKDSHQNWVELKNTGDTEIDLSEYSIAKKPGKKQVSWKLPAKKLQPGQLITFQLAGHKANPGNPMQSTVKLGDSETLVLNRGGKFVDGICTKEAPMGVSMGRAEGEKGFFFYSTPTRNAENGKDYRRFIAEMPQFDHAPGPRESDDKICLRLKNKNSKVHYTLNGSAPTMASPILKDSIVISKATTVRSFAEGDSSTIRSNIATMTYLPGVKHDMPVINITVNYGDLYNASNGIYADGPDIEEEWPHFGANYWNNWTRNAHVEIYDGNKSASVDCGIKIFGGYSRNLPKKSFCLKFKGMYGDSKLDFDFFGTGEPLGLKDLVLRSGAQDYDRCMMRDEFFTTLLKRESPELLTQMYRPAALYINGEYFGLYYMREKIDKHFVARKLNLPSTDSINIIMSKGYNEEGSGKAYKELISYVQNHDMSDAKNYEYISNLVDLQGLVDHKLGEIYSGNTDVGNIRYVRSTSPGNDNKWHFVFYDLDATWVGYKPGAQFYLSTFGEAAEAGVEAHNILISRLLKNKNFRELFLQRLSHHLATTFSPANANAVFDEVVARIRPEMERNCKRWPQLSYQQWEKNINDFKAKFEKKPKVMLDDLRKTLSITDAENQKYFNKLGY